MNGKLVSMLVVEMRRALHRRLVRWMIALALTLSALAAGRHLPVQPRPRRPGSFDRSPGAHGVLVGHRRRRR